MGLDASSSSYGKSKSHGKDAGVSRLSVGFRHLMDWGRETNNSIITKGMGPLRRPPEQLDSRLEKWLRYNMKSGDSSGLPGGGFPRAEAAIITGLRAETPEQAGFTKTPEWFDNYIRQMEYAIAEQTPGHLSGKHSNPALPSRRWIYGTPRRRPKLHSAGDIHQPTFEKLLKDETEIDSENISGPIHQVYTQVYLHMLASLNEVQPKEMENLIKFLMKQDEEGQMEGLAGMGTSMLRGMMRDPAFEGKVDEKVESMVAKRFGTEEARKAEGLSNAKSRQELLALLTKIGLVVETGHGELGGSEPMDVLFNKELELYYPDPDKPPKTIKIRLADITEEDWTKPGHHGTGTGKTQMKTEKEIKEHYNKKGGRIETYNSLIKMVRKYVDMQSQNSGLPGKGSGKGPTSSDQTWDAWYRRRATQIASDIQQNVGLKSKDARTGTAASSRGQQDLLRLELTEWLASGDAWFSENNIALENITAEDLKHVLHHMGSANAFYETAGEELGLKVTEYGEMIAFDQGDGEEFTVVINFNVYQRGDNAGLVKELATADIAIIKRSLVEIFLSFWAKNGGLTDQQAYEAWDLVSTVSGMSGFASYFAEVVGVATAIPGSERKRFTVRADAAIPSYMDDLMYMFFHGGNNLMKKGMLKLMSEMDKIARQYSSTLRPQLWGKLSDRWPTYAWGAQNTTYGGGSNDDRMHSGPKFPPKGFSLQRETGLDFGQQRQFFPQEGDKMLEDAEAYTARTGFAEPFTLQDDGTRSPRRKRITAEFGKTDFEQMAFSEAPGVHHQYSGRWWTASTPSWWPDARARNVSTDPLEFVWAAPYVTWQHYQMSGSVKK